MGKIIFKEIQEVRDKIRSVLKSTAEGKKILDSEVAKSRERLVESGVTADDELIAVEDEIRGLYNYKLSVVAEIVDYIKTFKWTNSISVEEKVKWYLLNKCDLKALKEAFGASYGAAKTLISTASTDVKKVIGEKTLGLIDKSTCKAEVDAAVVQFRFNTETPLEKLFIKQAVEKFPEPISNITFNIEDCEKELQVLKLCSIPATLKRLAQVDNERLTYILSILSSIDSDNTYKRIALYEFLTDKINTVDALFQEFIDENIFA